MRAAYKPVEDAAETAASGTPESAAQEPTFGRVHGAFSGLLGQDDDRTQKEAAALPLLSPYKDVPASHQQTTAPVTVAPAADNTVHSENAATDSKKESVMNAAFAVPPSEEASKPAEVVQAGGASTDKPSDKPAVKQVSGSEPLQLGGVEAQQISGNPLNRPKFIYRPATSVVDNTGHKVIRPDVRVAADSESSDLPMAVQLANFADAPEGTLPPPNLAPENAYPIDEEQWTPQMSNFDNGACDNCQGNNCHQKGWLHGGHNRCCGSGLLGVEYVEQAPFFIQTTQPFNNCRVRLDLARELEFPDRAEYFWAKTPGGKGPGNTLPAERFVNYQDLDFYIEKGTKRLSIGTDLPIRAIDPELRDNTAGFADMSVRTKAVLMDGTNWQITQLFNTYLPTGSAHRGTGNGHVSLEPGVAYRWKWSDWTYFHGDLKYWFPIGADSDYSGQVFNYGFGWSHVWLETDTWALIPTLEFECWTFLDGRQTLPGQSFTPGDPGPPPVDPIQPGFDEIDSIGVMNVCPGIRWVCDKGCDCGTKEFGISAGVSVTNEHLYKDILRLEFRWSR